MAVITSKQLKEGKAGSPVNGICLIKGYQVKKTRNGDDYITGQIQSGEIMNFKAWSNSKAFKALKEADYSNQPTNIIGSFDEYQGSMSITLTDVFAVEGYEASQFLEVKYSAETYATALKNLLKQTVSEKAYNLVDKYLFSNTELWGKFTEEFAAMSHHDNCKSGLLVHTYKVLCLMSWALGTYPSLNKNESGEASQDRKDLLMVGTLLHDIGKVDEMHYGVYQPLSSVTHRILGLDYIFAMKDDIIAIYDEKWYRDLQSIIVEHHGEFGDPCRTVPAYLVHKLDCLDSVLTGVQQAVDSPTEDIAGTKIYIDGMYLAI